MPRKLSTYYICFVFIGSLIFFNSFAFGKTSTASGVLIEDGNNELSPLVNDNQRNEKDTLSGSGVIPVSGNIIPLTPPVELDTEALGKQKKQLEEGDPDANEERGEKAIENDEVKSDTILSEPFGYRFFKLARERVISLEESIKLKSQGRLADSVSPPTYLSALTGFIGPMEMATSSFHATIPQNYVLGVGDVLRGSFWDKSIDPIEVKLIIDLRGYVTVPKIGKVLASGLTLERFQKNLETLYERSQFKYMKFMVTLDQLKSIHISITGEAFRPGDYAVSAATTLYNALFACGGISLDGSLRDIRLLRNREVIRVDFYDFLLQGENHGNIPLKPGDTIYIPIKKRSVTIEGEVIRPGNFELKSGEGLSRLLQMSGGVKATAYIDRIQIESVSPNRKKKVVDINFDDKGVLSSTLIQHGDRVTVFPILKRPENFVELKGAVDRPGKFELKPGMKVSDLFSSLNQPLKEVYLKQADILRKVNETDTIRLLFNLDEALKGNPDENLLLKEEDQVTIYTIREAAFFPPNEIEIVGAVQKPGVFQYSEKMTLSTLLFLAGGILEEAFLEEIVLERSLNDREITRQTLNLKEILAGDPKSDVTLQPRDRILVFDKWEVRHFERNEVTIYGAVQRPKVYKRSAGMRLRDAIFLSGGLVPGYYNILEMVRKDAHSGNKIIRVDLNKLMKGDEEQNIVLKDEDIIMVRKRSDYLDEPILVTLGGEVQNPGTYALKTRNDTISDVVNRAQGLTEMAYEKGAVFRREKEQLASKETKIDIGYVNDVLQHMNKHEYQRQLARNQYLWASETGTEVKAPISETAVAAIASGDSSDASKAKAMVAPGMSKATSDMTSSLISAAQDKPSSVSPARELRQEELTPSNRVIFDLNAALNHPKGSDDFILKNGDTITIPQIPTTVSVIGAVVRPTVMNCGKYGPSACGDLDDFIDQSGGYSQDAASDKAIVFRVNGSIIPVQRLEGVEVGDVIYVPNKPMSTEIVTTADKILDTIKYAVVTLTGYWMIIAILAL